jgi:hypothetical protein
MVLARSRVNAAAGTRREIISSSFGLGLTDGERLESLCDSVARGYRKVRNNENPVRLLCSVWRDLFRDLPNMAKHGRSIGREVNEDF